MLGFAYVNINLFIFSVVGIPSTHPKDDFVLFTYIVKEYATIITRSYFLNIHILY